MSLARGSKNSSLSFAKKPQTAVVLRSCYSFHVTDFIVDIDDPTSQIPMLIRSRHLHNRYPEGTYFVWLSLVENGYRDHDMLVLSPDNRILLASWKDFET